MNEEATTTRRRRPSRGFLLILALLIGAPVVSTAIAWRTHEIYPDSKAKRDLRSGRIIGRTLQEVEARYGRAAPTYPDENTFSVFLGEDIGTFYYLILRVENGVVTEASIDSD